MTSSPPDSTTSPTSPEDAHAELLRQLDLETKRADLAQKKATARQTKVNTWAAAFALALGVAGIFGYKSITNGNEATAANDTVSSQDQTITGLNKKINDQSGAIASNEAQISTLQQDNASLDASNKDLTQKNTDLSGQVASLSSQLAAVPSAAAAGPAPTTAGASQSGTAAGQVRHTDPYDLVNNGTNPDLDTPAGDPQWGSSGDNSNFSADFYPASGHPPGLNPALPSVKFVILSATAPSYDACHKATGYQNIVLPLNDIQTGDLVCVQTGEGRFSAMAVTNVTNDKVSFLITTYQK